MIWAREVKKLNTHYHMWRIHFLLSVLICFVLLLDFTDTYAEGLSNPFLNLDWALSLHYQSSHDITCKISISHLHIRKKKFYLPWESIIDWLLFCYTSQVYHQLHWRSKMPVMDLTVCSMPCLYLCQPTIFNHLGMNSYVFCANRP